jgi:DNA replicative helicase MCM subunit Mcm2 (Cdc46/Mcm family)
LEEEDEKVVARLKDKKYQEIKGKELDKVWKKIVPNEEKKKMEKETIEFIDSKKVEVQEMTNNFRDGI